MRSSIRSYWPMQKTCLVVGILKVVSRASFQRSSNTQEVALWKQSRVQARYDPRKILPSTPKLFSIQPAWREELWSTENQRRSTLKVNPSRMSCTFKKAG